jgi:TolB-like protein
MGILNLLQGQHEKSIEFIERALAIEPNSADYHTYLAGALGCAGRWAEGIGYSEISIRMSPRPSVWYYWTLGRAYFMTGQYNKAVETFKKSVQINPDHLISHAFLAACYSSLNRQEEAAAETDEVLRINPKFNLESFAKTLPYKNKADIERYIDALRKAGLPENSTLQRREKPSIAVLPFDNMSDDSEQDYFADGISEDLITDLSKISNLLVISRMSSFSYKGKDVKVQEIAEELGVRYVLEGSVRKAKDRLRINAQLIDASTGHHLWADRYDGDMSDIFALQDNITGKIISALALKLTTGEQIALADRGTDNIQAYDSFLKGRQGYRLLTTAGFSEAKLHLEKAIEMDPGFSRAYAALAVLYWKAVQTASPELREGLGLTSRAKKNAVRNRPQLLLKEAMKKPTALAHGLMSQIYLFRYQHDEALAEIERAVAMDPNDPELYAWMSHILWLMGKSEEAAEAAKMGLRLDPNNPTAYLIHLARSSLPDGDLEESLKVLKRAERLNPELSGSIALMESIIYGIQGRNEEAHTAYETFLRSRLSPVHNLNAILLHLNFADPKKLDRIANALIKAGAPGKSTDYYKILKQNRLNGQEVRSLLLGQKITGTSMSTGKQVWWEWSTEGDLKITGAYEDVGKSWVEGDVFFIQWEKHFGGLPWGTIIYKNPDGSMESQDQYLMVSDMGSITPFTITK